MSDLVPSNTKVPAHIANLIGKGEALAQSLSGGIGGDFASVPRISLKGARFRIVEDGEEVVLEDTKIDVVIVGANPGISKTYYDKPWKPGDEPESPPCFSWNGIRPHPEAASPQSDLCANCPHNAWGSKISESGAELKACPDSKRLAVVAADDPEDTIYQLVITASVLKSLKKYTKELAMRGWPVQAVRTQLSFDSDASYPKLQLKFNGFLDEDAVAKVMERMEDEDVINATSSNQPDAPVPSSKPANTGPSVVASDDDDVDEPAPKKEAKGFGAKKAAKVEEADDVDEPAPKKEAKGFGAKKAAKAESKPAPKAVVADNADDLMAEIESLVAGAADDE